MTGYRVERCQGASCSSFAEIATPTSTSFSDTSLSSSTSYSYRVRASDAVPNLGSYSSVASATTAAPPSAQLYYIHPDHLNTPRVVSNQAQQTVWRWDNDDPFGANMANANPSGLGTFTFNLRLPGQYFDSETNYHYNYFRDYSPEIGRYIESDPIGVLGLAERYGRVDLRPLARAALRLESIEALLVDAETIASIRWVTAPPLVYQTNFNLYTYVEGKPLSVTDPTGQIGVSPPPRGGGSSSEVCGTFDLSSCYLMCSTISKAMGEPRGNLWQPKCRARCSATGGTL